MPQFECASAHPEYLADGREIAPGDNFDLSRPLSPHDEALVSDGRITQLKTKPRSRQTKKETTP